MMDEWTSVTRMMIDSRVEGSSQVVTTPLCCLRKSATRRCRLFV